MGRTHNEPFLVRLKDVFVAFSFIGFITFGGPQAHIAVYHKMFVEDRKWIGDKAFVDLLGLGSALPGPTSSQMVAAIGYIHANLAGGLVALLCFQLPGAIIMGAAGLSMRNPSVADFLNSPPDWFVGFKQGVWASAIVLIALAVYKIGKKSASTPFTQAIATTTTILALLIETAWTLPLFLVVSGIASYIYQTVYPPPPSPDQIGPSSIGQSLPLRNSHSLGKKGYSTFDDEAEPEVETVDFSKTDRTVGAVLIVSTFAIFVALEVLSRVMFKGSLVLSLAEIFYRVGFLIYGGGQVVLPMLLVEVVNTGFITEDDFLYGYALVQILPGPIFNFAAFLGAIIAGWGGMVVSWLCIFGPGIILILGVYPFWAALAKQPWMQKLLVGVNAGALGLIISAFLILWGKIPLQYNSCAVYAYLLAGFFDISIPIVILTSGLLGILINLLF